MAQFRDRLVALGEFTAKRGKKSAMFSWSEARATALANHVFTDMIGNLQDRLTPIINSYGRVDPITGGSSRTAVLASNAAMAEGYPQLVKQFCQSVARGIEMDSASSAWHLLLRQVNEYKKFQTLETLKLRAANKDEEILNFLKGRGLTTGPGIPLLECLGEDGMPLRLLCRRHNVHDFVIRVVVLAGHRNSARIEIGLVAFQETCLDVEETLIGVPD